MKLTIAFAVTVLMVGCSSTTSLEDVQKQEDKARSELSDAKEELVELAETKEEYSVDSRDAMIKEYKARQKTIKSDIKNLKKLESKDLEKNSESMIDGLEKEDKILGKKIDQLKDQKEEDWASARDSINDMISRLEMKIDQITANISEK